MSKYRVLMAVDRNDERALAQAEAVANLPQATEEVEAIIFHVFTDNPEGASVHQLESARAADEYLEERGVETRFLESSGNPADIILEAAKQEEVDAVCITGRKRTPAGKVVFGSVTQSVILSSEMPVIVCGVDDKSF